MFSKRGKGNLVNAERNKVQLLLDSNCDWTQSLLSQQPGKLELLEPSRYWS